MRELFGVMAVLFLMNSCKQVRQTDTISKPATAKSIGIILLNHGSRSAVWRDALLNLERKVRDSLLLLPKVKSVKTAFMEYEGTSLAMQLNSLDSLSLTDIIIIPVFLTVSTHSFDDIPTIIGKKEDPQSIENLKIEKIERYTPKANTHITPLLDFSGILKENVLRRVRSLSGNVQEEGLTLIGYGDATYNTEWTSLFKEIAEYVGEKTGIKKYTYGWCGHLVHYSPDSTTAAINALLLDKEKAIVIPVLLAQDEMFQVKIIGDGIKKVKGYEEKVLYRPDAILPDPNVEKWINTISAEYTRNILEGRE